METKEDQLVNYYMFNTSYSKVNIPSWVWWCMSVISALGRLRQKNHKYKASLK
jgi:hypothetical protein